MVNLVTSSIKAPKINGQLPVYGLMPVLCSNLAG